MNKCVILSAGKGTRMSSITNGTSKEMLLINSRPLIYYSIDEAIRSGCGDILVVTDKSKIDLNLYLDLMGINIVSIESKSMMQSLKAASNFVGNDEFILMFPDMFTHNPILEGLIIMSEKYSKSILALCDSRSDFGSGYFVDVENIDDNVFRIIGFTNNPNGIRVFGRYVFTSGIYEYINQLPDNDSEVDLLNLLVSKNDLYGVYFDNELYDVGTPDGYEQTIKSIA